MTKTTKTKHRTRATRKPTQGKGAQGRGRGPTAPKSPPAVKSAPAIAPRGSTRKATPRDDARDADNTPTDLQSKSARPHLKAYHFKPGAEWTGNAAGRPKSARSKVSESFLEDLHELWSEAGKTILQRLAVEKPGDVVRAVVALLPKEVDVTVSQYETMTDDQLHAQLRAAAREAKELGVDLAALLNDETVH